MLFLNIPRIAHLRSITHPYTFLKKNGFSHHTAKKLVSGAMLRPDMRHLEKLCRLFLCTPHDLYDYRPSKDLITGAADPLAFLTKPQQAADLRTLITGLPLSEVQAIIDEAQRRATNG